MKKLLSLILTAIMLLSLFAFTSCKDEEAPSYADTVRVTTLNGTTGFGMAKLMADNEAKTTKNSYNFTVESDASKVTDGLIAKEIDIAALPTNAAANLYNKTGGAIQIIAINTLGVLYVLDKTNSVSSLEDLNGKTIYVPAQNPTFILKYILKANNINATVDSTTYSAPDALRTAVVAGKVDIAVLPEPMVTIATSANSDYKVVIDLTKEWNETPNSETLVQGCVVVRKEFAEKYPDSVSAFLNEYKASIEYLNANPADAAEHVAKYGIFANKAVATKAIPKCNIAYMDGNEMKAAMKGFLNAMNSVAPASIGNAIPADDFYYIAS